MPTTTTTRDPVLIGGRVLAAALTAWMAWIHLELWLDGFREVDVIGPLFLLNVIGAGILAVLLLVTPLRLLAVLSWLGALFTAGTLAALLISMAGEFFGVTETLDAPYVLTTIIVEGAGTVVLVALAVLARRATRSPAP